jgi:hypothetical protein
MRFEVTSALVVGIALPLLETIRRGIAHWSINVTTMLEDYLAGGVLLGAAFLAIRAKRSAPQFLVAAWAFVTSIMTGSFAYQLEATIRGVYLEPRNPIVLTFKLLLWGACVTSLVLSLRDAIARSQACNDEKA